MKTSPGPPASESAKGVIFSLAAYGIWGFLPLYFVAMAPSGPWEILGWRVLFALAVCAVIITGIRSWPTFVALVRDRRTFAMMGVAGILIYVNWQVYLLASLSGRVLEASLGYFITPLATVLLAVVVLRERIRPMQAVALVITGVAVLVIVIGYGVVPWAALALAASFSGYSLVKKRVGPRVDALSGLTAETMWLTPIAVAQLVLVGATSGLTIGAAGGWHLIAVLSTGVVTAVPLLLFAAGARRISLTTVGLLQFAAPLLQFIIGVWILHEPMPPERWIGFALVWVAIAVLMTDMTLSSRKRQPVPPPG